MIKVDFHTKKRYNQKRYMHFAVIKLKKMKVRRENP